MSVFADASVDISPAEASRRHEAGELVLIDIREPYEWEAGRVPGSHHIEIERVASSAPVIPRDVPVAFLSRRGIRAGMVAQAFRAVGYDAYNVEGGMTAWHADGLPMEPDGATVAPH